mgnify:FL=1|jgi:hypothetical protein
MTAEQQKAKELIEKFGKHFAILCVDEIIISNPHSNPFNTELYSTMEFWQTVKQEIINYKQ